MTLLAGPAHADEPGQAEAPASPAAAATPAPLPAPKRVTNERTPEQVQACMVQYGTGPSLADLQRAAVRAAGVSARQVKSAMSGSALRGLLPHLHLVGLYRGDSQEYQGKTWDRLYPKFTDYKDRTESETTGGRYYLGGMLSFQLDRLAVGASRLSAVERAGRFRHGVIERVTNLATLRKAAVLRLCSRDWPYKERLERAMEVERLTALVNGLAGRAFYYLKVGHSEARE